MSSPPDPRLAPLIEALSGTNPEFEPLRAHFMVRSTFIVATIDEITSRILVRAILDPDEEESLVRGWVERQPQPVTGALNWSTMGFDDVVEYAPVLAFERSDDTVWAADPLVDEIDAYRRAWNACETVEPATSAKNWVTPDDPRDLAPESAWLLFGSDESYPDSNELEEQARGARIGMYVNEWTAASNTLRGDLLLIYFIKPRKAVHFIARAASDAHFVREEVDAASAGEAQFSPTQWWVDTTPLVKIEPIPLERLLDSTGGGLVLNSRSGIFMDPRAITRLEFRAQDLAQQGEVERIAATPTGLADLPSPTTMTFDEWRDIASGALKLEAHVSSHIVEPLLRWLIPDQDMTFVREYRIGKRLADFVVLDRDRNPIHVIEVKKRIKSAHGQRWEDTPDFAQVRWYADRLKVAATLIDSQRLMLVDHRGGEPTRIFTRRDLATEDLASLRTHMLGSVLADSPTRRFRVHNAMDRHQRPFGTLETDDTDVLLAFTRDDGIETNTFSAEIRAQLTLQQLMGSYRNFVFTPESLAR